MASVKSSESPEKVVLPIHPPQSIYKDDPRAVLTESEQSMYDEVLRHFTREEPVYSIPNIEKGELLDDEKFWLSREGLLRYLRASKWKVATAITRLESTLKWRREYGIYELVNAAHVEPEAVTGKEILFGYDVKGKPAFYMIPSRQNTEEATRQIQFAVWMLERCVDLMEPGVETIALLINFADKAKNPSMSTARAVLNILQDHYPERLGLALIINVPWVITLFLKAVMPFVDPITREKIKFNPVVVKDGLFTSDMVMKQWWGGDHDFEYDHEKYWTELNTLCDTRVETWKKNWRDMGAKVGLSEWDYKKGSQSEDTPEVKALAQPVAVKTSEPESTQPVNGVEKKKPLVDETRMQDRAPAQAEGTSSNAGQSVTATTTAGAVAGAGGSGDAAGGSGGGGDAGGDAGGE
ncbi:CRAL/TRIO domain-containing protein [Crassisporium funariophilum]|nr:CRAL/TRIO domain-containing protein [Crassisporium funariophilum]